MSSYYKSVWESGQLSGAKLLIVLSLAYQLDTDGVCYPSQRSIAERCRLSEDAVKRNLRALAQEGYLSIIPRFDENGGRVSNSYQINKEVLNG
jgi:DNA-binding MarR family transcriptional regulator